MIRSLSLAVLTRLFTPGIENELVSKAPLVGL